MRKLLIVGIVIAAGAAAYFGFIRREQPAAAAEQGQSAQGGPGGRGGQGGNPGGMGGGGFGGPGGGFGGPGGGFRPPMTVELAKVSRGRIAAYLSVVGNLVGEATVEVIEQRLGPVSELAKGIDAAAAGAARRERRRG